MEAQLNAEALKRVIQTRVLGQVVHYWNEVDSTNAAVLLGRLEKHYFYFLADGKRLILQEWRSRSFLGRRVRVHEEDMHVEGVAMDLDEEGCLLVTLDDGSSVRVREGEVVPLMTEGLSKKD